MITEAKDHVQIEIAPGIHVDEGIAEDVLRLWNADVQTFFSCEGGPTSWSNWASRYVVVYVRDIAVARRVLPWVERSGGMTDRRKVALYAGWRKK